MKRKNLVTVSREVHRALCARAVGRIDDRETVYHANGTVTFPVSDDVYVRLLALGEDVELSVRKLLDMGVDA